VKGPEGPCSEPSDERYSNITGESLVLETHKRMAYSEEARM
jgi:hypothetical protein